MVKMAGNGIVFDEHEQVFKVYVQMQQGGTRCVGTCDSIGEAKDIWKSAAKQYGVYDPNLLLKAWTLPCGCPGDRKVTEAPGPTLACTGPSSPPQGTPPANSHDPSCEDIVRQFVQPAYDDWFMGMVFYINMKSPDPATKHGCILVGPDHRPVGFGFNGPPRNMDDERIPWFVRPDKYYFSIHSEDNAFKNSDRRTFEDCTLYVTGFPCHHCWLDILQNRVGRVVYGPHGSVFGRQTEYSDGDDQKYVRMLLDRYKGKIEIVEYKGDPPRRFVDSLLYWANRVKPNMEEIEVALGNWVVSVRRRSASGENKC